MNFRMSRPAQLPPRCPLQKKTTANQADVPVCPPSFDDIEFQPRQRGHYRSISQSSISEEQRTWVNDLLIDSDLSSSGTLHCRAASDSLTLTDSLAPLPDLDQLYGTEAADSCEPDNELGSSCNYGPNSPRRKSKIDFPEKDIISAISEYVVQNPMQRLDEYFSVSGVQHLDSVGGPCGSAGEINTGNKQMKCHPGQRSRAQKLQYIAELERSVDILQNVRSELSVRVDSQIVQRATLSVENDALKQQLLRVQQRKFIVDGEYQSLKKEAERLRTGLTIFTDNKIHNRQRSAAYLAD